MLECDTKGNEVALKAVNRTQCMISAAVGRQEGETNDIWLSKNIQAGVALQ
jgi:hypothetical protein